MRGKSTTQGSTHERHLEQIRKIATYHVGIIKYCAVHYRLIRFPIDYAALGSLTSSGRRRMPCVVEQEYPPTNTSTSYYRRSVPAGLHKPFGTSPSDVPQARRDAIAHACFPGHKRYLAR